MTKKLSFPNPDQTNITVEKMKNICEDFDSINLELNQLISQIEIDISNSKLTTYRLRKESSIA